MADVDIAAVVDEISVSESASVGTATREPSVVDTVSVAESVVQKKAISLLPGRNVITLQSIGDLDWLWSHSFPGNMIGIKVHAVVVMAAGAETFVLRDGTTSGPVWFKSVTTGAASQVYLFGGILLRPVMAIADQTGIDAASRYAILFDKP